MKKVVIALGGNALIKHPQIGKYEQQLKNVQETCEQIAKLVKKGYCIVLTHGNGPQVGNLQIRMLAASPKIPAMPLDVDVAMTQAQIGYLLQQSLKNFLPSKKIATVVTEVLVDAKDKAFRIPTKPIGPFYKIKSAIKKTGVKKFIEDAGRGYRKVVASPIPKKIIQIDEIRNLMKNCNIVICCGGGGIPVLKKNKKRKGVEAVIDKDHCAQLLGNSLGIGTLIILTDVEHVKINYRKRNEKDLREVKIKQLKKYLKEGHFAEGSMKPKVEAAIDFLEKGGKKVIITSLNKLSSAIAGRTGTIITK